MPGYQVRFQDVAVGGRPFHIRSLLDRQQYHDPEGLAEQAGISPANWPLFGQVWPAAQLLASEMATFAIAGKHILEVGAGLALASLMVHRRHGDITASDAHPLAPAFFAENLRLNQLEPMPYLTSNWARDDQALGRFDLIIGSDILYERDQPAQVAAFIDRHATADGEVLVVDPGRSNRAAFRLAMVAAGFDGDERQIDFRLTDGHDFHGRRLYFRRGVAS